MFMMFRQAKPDPDPSANTNNNYDHCDHDPKPTILQAASSPRPLDLPSWQLNSAAKTLPSLLSLTVKVIVDGFKTILCWYRTQPIVIYILLQLIRIDPRLMQLQPSMIGLSRK